FFLFRAEDRIRDFHVTGVQTCALPIFANRTLWPAMHDRADLIEYQPEEFKTYQDVNRLFAQQLSQVAHPDDIIWVHDYHFFSVEIGRATCRERGALAGEARRVQRARAE